MGESRKKALKLGFDGSVRLEFRGATVSSDTGLLAYRDVDDVFALTATASAALKDCRTGTNIRHSLTALLRQSIYSRLAGYDDLNDADRLAVDPVMRQLVGGRATDKEAASTSQMARFETEVLTQADKLAALMELPGKWIDRVEQLRLTDRIILDLDSSVSETHGQQEGSAYNGYFECTCYHPLFCFNQDGDLERALLRYGNVASADDWRSVLEPVVARLDGIPVRPATSSLSVQPVRGPTKHGDKTHVDVLDFDPASGDPRCRVFPESERRERVRTKAAVAPFMSGLRPLFHQHERSKQCPSLLD